MESQDLFAASYEDGYLRRELGDVVSFPDVALTELIANAYDAGASEVKITMPNELQGLLVVEDDGVGMSFKHINERWLKLRYSRLKHQGPNVSFPPERKGIKRRAYGRNGIGRHGMFCFSDCYTLETWQGGLGHRLDIGLATDKPIEILSNESFDRKGHGTRLSVVVNQHLYPEDKLIEMLASKFISMPDFTIRVNGKAVSLNDHPGNVDEELIEKDGVSFKVTVIDSKYSVRTQKYKGVGVWVGGRRVGEMDWRLGKLSFLDGRRSFSMRFAFIVQTESLRNEISEDWASFKPKSELVDKVASLLLEFINRKRKEFLRGEVAEIKREAILSSKSELDSLPQLARQEVSDFIDEILDESPDMKIDMLMLAVKAAINLEKSHHGQSLLSKLTTIESDDVEALDQLLDDWSAKDALKVLSEIDARLKVIETIRRLSGDEKADELHTIHPLILKARWLFGPEFESSEYSSNVGLVKTVEQVFGARIDKSQFLNSKKRPDIVILENASLGAQALEEVDEDGIATVKNVLLIEVKKGGFPIGRDEINQANGYVQDIVYSEVLASRPYVNAIVVGEKIESKTARSQDISDTENAGKAIGKVKAVTFSMLVSTAEQRLFRLRDKLNHRYDHINTSELKVETLGVGAQIPLQ
ncbi:ATP-binding protein [Neptuniibacter sp.]|uniref:ATP-binding protein n=1 Tax=Neptuniibacter sp. TaxID=1962643 RepID=UPI003B5C352F